MDKLGFEIFVLGSGHLAAAVRVQLRRARRLFAGPCEHDRGALALFVACSDFENATLCPALAQRMRQDRAIVLFACVTSDTLRVGPLITPDSLENLFARYLPRSWDFRRSFECDGNFPLDQSMMQNAGTARMRLAQIGATLLVGELAKVLLGEEATRLVRCVTEFDSPSFEGGIGRWATADNNPTCDAARPTTPTRDHHVWNQISHLWHHAQI